MKRILLTIILAVLMSIVRPGVTLAKLNIIATLPEIGALVEEIGGDRVEVFSLARGDEDPHVLPAKPSHSRRMLRADLLVFNGLQLEVGWLPLLIRGARNPDIRSGGRGHLDLSEAVRPLEVPMGGADRSEGDVHPEGNPHYTVDPVIYPTLATLITERLTRLDPDGTDYFKSRLITFIEDWQSQLESWKERLRFLSGLDVITYHQQWEYFAQSFGMAIVDKIENRPGIPPSPRHLIDLENWIESDGVHWILYSDLVHPDLPERLGERGGCRVIRLPQSIGSREGTESLVSWFETIVSIFEEAHGAP